MVETTLVDYFNSTATTNLLSIKLKDISLDTYYDLPEISPIKVFQVRKDNLLKLCNHVISGALTPEELTKIAAIINWSDHFETADWSSDGFVVETVVSDWGNPDTKYPLTIENLKNRWKIFLELGKHGPHYP